jgi:hypothetical protein
LKKGEREIEKGGFGWEKKERQGALCKRGHSPFFFPSTPGQRRDRGASGGGALPALQARPRMTRWGKDRG